MSVPSVFLDANVLFSAALGGDSFELLFELGARARVRLLTSAHCVSEARVNLERKRPGALGALLACIAVLERAPDVESPSAFAAGLLPLDDALVLDAALAVRADVLVTGDRRHFGPLMERNDRGLRVCTVRDFLLAGPGA